MSSSDDFFKGLILGAVVGATAGILLAPKSGAETEKISGGSLQIFKTKHMIYIYHLEKR